MRSAAPRSSSIRPEPRFVLRALLLTVLTASLGGAQAQTLQDGPPPQHRLVYRNALFVRVNPVGLIDDARITYRFRLYPSESLALRDNFIGIGLAPSASPAFGRVGVLAEFQPLTLLQVSALWERVQYFGGFNFLQSFPSARSPFGDTLLSQRSGLPESDPLRNYTAGGSQLTLGANLQVKVGPVVARTQAKLVRPDFALREGDTVLYDSVYDVLAPNRGWFFTNDADVLYQPGGPLMMGVRWTMTQAFYGAEHFATGEVQEDLNAMHRVGPLVAYTFFNQDGAAFNSPTLFATANWWVRHRYRAGQESSALMPMVAVGISFSGDLLPVREGTPQPGTR
ncbi:MAG: hypothetical protein L0Y66_21360 [Myxococcaceae bacterium]|nr:hypothetical protein [Myxococcaceae bacterium]MCI0673226.1 hypothetical protein [Myxococcaceae bacterium]